MKNAIRAGLLLLVTACAAAGCAGAGWKTKAFWVRKDGGEPDVAAVREARARCEQHANESYQKRAPGHMNIDWAAIMRQCMDESGYVLITKPRQ